MELELPAREPSLTRENARRGSFGQRGRLSVRLSPFQRLLSVKGKDRSGSEAVVRGGWSKFPIAAVRQSAHPSVSARLSTPNELIGCHAGEP